MSVFRYMAFPVLFLFIFCFASCSSPKQTIQPHSPEPGLAEEIKKQPAATPEIKKICITGVGDIMLGTNFPSEAYLPEDNGQGLLVETSRFFKNSDIVFGNLEGSFLNAGKCYKACSDPEKCYAFRMPEAYGLLLKKAGFNLLSIANNHIGDFGLPGREKTTEVLTNNKINFAGLDTHPSTVFEKDDIRYGFCAFAPNVGTPDLRDPDKAAKTVKELAEKCDIVIVSFHGGAEGAENRHVTRSVETFYGENRGNVYEFSHKVIDAGADIVFGHGPHISRAIELYKGRFIAYSLGNFCTFARFNLKGPNGIAPIMKVYVDKEGAFLSGKIIPVFQGFRKGPVFDETQKAIKEIKELTESDFPKTALVISDEGIINLKN